MRANVVMACLALLYEKKKTYKKIKKDIEKYMFNVGGVIID